jgi:hypothetical protein
MDQCVGCGEWDDLKRRHCDPKRERAIESRRTGFDVTDTYRTRNFGTRLREGFAMLRGDLVATMSRGGE